MNFLWAGSYAAYKQLQSDLPVGDIVTLRYGLAAALLAMLWPLLPGRPPRGKDFWRVILIGIFVFALAPRLQALGVAWGRASDASVLAAFDPLITSVAAGIFLREQIASQRWIGFVLGIAGVLLLSDRRGGDAISAARLAANALILASYACESAYSVLGKSLLDRCSLWKILGAALLSGAAANLLWDGPSCAGHLARMPARAWLILLYLAAACTLAGYWLWYAAMRERPVHQLALTIFIQPFAGVLISVVWVREHFQWSLAWGGAAILIGLYVGFRKSESAAPAPPP